MSNEFETNEPSVKVELHFHVSLAAPSRPDWTAWTSGDPNAPRFSSEPTGKSRWVAKSFGVLALVSMAVVGASFVHRLSEGRDNRAELVSALAPHPRLPPPVAVDGAGPENPAVEAEAPQGTARVHSRGTAAFGLR
ncbi:hypothetical protein [uncultured Rhodoblastus sp.]|uniref:hypothetical protein n=1 Tax=uncultured Rhodoblastus sp. TaxID=543037 RepID=UPI0025EF1544|nr:hypothetical protein [uncultured Rhodoblastus sp.]